jgi:midasin (ATPase involved in ribosome maturation)
MCLSDRELQVSLQEISGQSTSEIPPEMFLPLEDDFFTENLHKDLFQNAHVDSLDPIWINSSHLSTHVVDICGVILPRFGKPLNSNGGTLVETPTTRQNLTMAAMAVSIRTPVLLEGPIGSGKTALVEELAWRLGLSAKLVKIHLGDEADGKSLLGSYILSDTPGKFLWKKGAFATAVEEGHWVLLEDIDTVSKEIVSVLMSLLEKRTLYIPQRGCEIAAHPNFQIFATASHDPFMKVKKEALVHGLGASLWTRLTVAPLTRDEIIYVIETKFKSLSYLAQGLASAFESMCQFYHNPLYVSPKKSGGRCLSTRDLVKWCFRIESILSSRMSLNYPAVVSDENVLEGILREALDVFICMIPSLDLRLKVLSQLSNDLQIPSAKQTYFLQKFIPDINVVENTFKIGRVHFKVAQNEVKFAQEMPFATTAHASRLLERVAIAVIMNEPVLLVGETGTGKTTTVQTLAKHLNKKLHVLNLSQQTECVDLFGGFKPVSVSSHVPPLLKEFEELFRSTFSVRRNVAFLELINKAAQKKKYGPLADLLLKSTVLADERLKKVLKEEGRSVLTAKWNRFKSLVEKFRFTVNSSSKLIFSFVEGIVVSALQKGEWVLLDEVNLATSETLQALSGLFESNGSVLLSERGDDAHVPRHVDFRIFACMNPATDVGKKDIPLGVRNRFTEIYVDPPDDDLDDLRLIVASYLDSCLHLDNGIVEDVVQYYTETKALASTNLCDGANIRPHFSLRTLSRALMFATTHAALYGLRRALAEGMTMTFVTLLDFDSQNLLKQCISRHILHNKSYPLPKSVLSQQEIPGNIRFEYFWLKRGSFSVQPALKPYILTATVHQNLCNLARAVMAERYPILIQGPTSSGKTSMVEYLAHQTGHKFVRVNNHEHTDLQEYLGCYVSDDEGRLVFKEGALVTALKEGHWIVLDELNLAPTDVLEALNRLLDDNRELFVQETQEVVRPHPNFMIFATQNPPSYGGRKVLSRAFRNRFLELHFDDLPESELQEILCKRCSIAPSYAAKMIKVYQELRRRRQEARLFDGKASFVTLRDLFRWASRGASSYQGLAEDGWMILGERVRTELERNLVQQILESVLKVKLVPTAMYDKLFEEHRHALPTSISWNSPMKRLFALTLQCIVNQEPVLLVGDTGCGKTTICQVIAALFDKTLTIINCHQHTETSDLIGSQRPRRSDESTNSGKLFQWRDGPLVDAMKKGNYFLLDEISLAEDSVLERLNSVLETSRSLLLSEKGGDVESVTALDSFRILATMNPGGDYGKKELSPALRNRFTELWIGQIEDTDDLIAIVEGKVASKALAQKMLEFVNWFRLKCKENHVSTIISIRDLVSWSEFIVSTKGNLGLDSSFFHGGCLVLLDALKVIPLFQQCISKLETLVCVPLQNLGGFMHTNSQFGIGPFSLDLGPVPVRVSHHSLNSVSSRENFVRVLRALQIPSKAILLEGSPGVGKTSLVTSLASLCGRNLTRINLSEETDLIDLFGTDLPVEGGKSGEFMWRDGPFLSAMKQGHWVLLDELNLASQSILEGLNSCLDHRGTVFVPELDMCFEKHVDFRIFAAQNPLEEGGGRRGLPTSFLNRFTKVYIQPPSSEDLLSIVKDAFPQMKDYELLKNFVDFNVRLQRKTMITREFGLAGSPWEFNLRDVFRCLELHASRSNTTLECILDVLYLQRMQKFDDRSHVLQLWSEVMGVSPKVPLPSLCLSPNHVTIGFAKVERSMESEGIHSELIVPNSMLPAMQAVLKCVEMNWMSMIIGPSGSGKTSLVRTISSLCGKELQEVGMNSSVDALELLGGFEQSDLARHKESILSDLRKLTKETLRALQGSTLKVLSNDIRALAGTLNSLSRMNEITSDNLNFWIRSLMKVRQSLGLHSDEVHLMSLAEKWSSYAGLAGQFEWVSGVLVQAMQEGKWILLDNANLCSNSVLDRLNPLFESMDQRQLLINEKGMDKEGSFCIVKPHPDFRLFMTLDPKYGQISRAMRNRGIEICLESNQWQRDPYSLSQLLSSKCICDAALKHRILDVFENRDSRELIQAVNFLVDFVQRGVSIDQSLRLLLINQTFGCENVSQSIAPHTIVPRPPVMVRYSIQSLIRDKFSFLSGVSDGDPRTVEVAQDVILECSDIEELKYWVLSWLRWLLSRNVSDAHRMGFSYLEAVFLERFKITFHGKRDLEVRTIVRYLKFYVKQCMQYSRTSGMKLSELNLIQRSYCFFSSQRISELEISPILIQMYPLFHSFHCCFLASSNFSDNFRKVLCLMESLWSYCLLDSDLDINAVDAHCSQISEIAAADSSLMDMLQPLGLLRDSYRKGIELPRRLWMLLHPLTVRNEKLYHSVHWLLNADLSIVDKDMYKLSVQAVLNSYLCNANQQELLSDDVPRLVELLKSKFFSNNICCIDPSSLSFTLDSISKSLKEFSHSQCHWIWSASTTKMLGNLSESSVISLDHRPPFPNLATEVNFELLRLTEERKLNSIRQWNMIYFDLRKSLNAQPLFDPFPMKSSVRLQSEIEDLSVLRLGAFEKQVSEISHLFFENQHLIRLDVPREDLLLMQARLRCMQNMPWDGKAKAHMESARSFCEATLQSAECNFLSLGKAWIQLGLSIVFGAVPAVAIDPASLFSIAHRFAVNQLNEVQNELRVRRSIYDRDPAALREDLMNWLETEQKKLVDKVEESSRLLFLRPNNEFQEFLSLLVELHSLQNSLLSDKSLISHLLNMEGCDFGNDSINNVIKSLNMFADRSRNNFPYFSDLLDIVHCGVLEVIYGLQLVSYSIKHKIRSDLQYAVPYQLSANDINDLDANLAPLPRSGNGMVRVSEILHSLVHHHIEGGAASLVTYLELQKCFDMLGRIYFQIQLREKKKLDEEMMTFTFASKSFAIEEEEFNWFPESVDAKSLGIALDEEVSAMDITGKQPDMDQREVQSIRDATCNAFYIYMHIFGESQGPILPATSIASNSLEFLPLSLHVFKLDDIKNSLTHTIDQGKYDFYRDSNFKEIFRLRVVLCDLDVRVNELLVLYPDQAALQQILTVTNRIASLCANLPLVKFVESLGYLLEKCDEWERYASRQVSLRSNMDTISSLVVEWRRIELLNWCNLLNSFDQKERRDGAKLWLSLYSALRNCDNWSSDDLLQALDEFMQTSNLGQFKLRLEILKALYKNLKLDVLFNVQKYYSQFNDLVSDKIRTQRSLIENDLKNFVKLAGWKDVNVQALKQSAARTHRHLNKCLRKYQQCLQEPVMPLLNAVEGSLFSKYKTPKVEQSCSPSIVESCSSITESNHVILTQLQNWEAARISRMKSILKRCKSLCFVRPIQNPLQEITESMIERIFEFKEESVKLRKAGTKINTTSVLQVRKKAFSDLLKSLRSVGLKWHHSTVPGLLESMKCLALPEDVFTFSNLALSSNVYFFRVLALMQSFDQILGKRSGDLQSHQAERSIGFVTDLFKQVSKERILISSACRILADLDTFKESLEYIIACNPKERGSSSWITPLVCQVESLSATSLSMYLERASKVHGLSPQAMQQLSEIRELIKDEIATMKSAFEKNSKLHVQSKEIYLKWINLKKEIIERILHLISQFPKDSIILEGALNLLQSKQFDNITDSESIGLDTCLAIANDVTEKIMICIQQLHDFNLEKSETSLKAEHKQLLDLLNIGNQFSSVLPCFTELSRSLTSQESEFGFCLLKQLYPLLCNFVSYLQSTLHSIILYHKSLCKSTYVLAYNIQWIVLHGLDVPSSDTEESGEPTHGDDLEPCDGTGIGEGKGGNDVSEQIEDEEQVLGLKDDKVDEDNNEAPEGKQDNGMEMENDFDGAFEDVQLDGDEEDNENLSDAESTDDLDEGMDEVDEPESNKVDESLWQDDEEQILNEQDISNEKVKQGNEDVQCLEDTQDEIKEQEATGDFNNFDGHMDEEEVDQVSETDDAPEVDTSLENEIEEQPEGFNDADSEVGEDGKVDKADVDETEAQDEADDVSNMCITSDCDESDMELGKEDSVDESTKSAEPNASEMDDGEDEVSDTSKDPDNISEETSQSCNNKEVSESNVEVPPLDHSEMNNKDIETPQDMNMPDHGQQNVQSSGNPSLMFSLNSDKESNIDPAAALQPREEQREQLQEPQSGRESPQEEIVGAEQDLMNVMEKILSESMEKWQRDLQMIEQDNESNEVPPPVNSVDTEDLFEYTKEEESKEDARKLCSSENEQQIPLQEPNESKDMDVDMETNDAANAQDSNSDLAFSSESLWQKDGSLPSENLEVQESYSKVESLLSNTHISKDAPVTLDEEIQIRDNIQRRISTWDEFHYDPIQSRDLWAKYVALTYNYSLQLSEQLRLILEPTKAAKLNGDYKTGKRLNLRKIIPYIASDFKKDKIWLRRTKPSKREYQILIAVDDSQSMHETQSIQLAMESVCLVGRALQQLEVGQLGIASFGEEMNLVHAFNQPFSDDAGAQVIQKFSFRQQKTKIDHLLQSALNSFEEQYQGGSSDMWRLLLILSDGICDGHDRLRNLVRKASESRVIVAFIVLDQKPATESILQMNTVNFVDGKVEMKNYMSTFPFDFYIVLHDISRLPLVLSEALRQFFALAT